MASGSWLRKRTDEDWLEQRRAAPASSSDPRAQDGWLPRKRVRAASDAPGATGPPLTPAQEAVLQLAREGRSLFLTGAAGTGKSRVLLELKRRLPGEVVLTALTGVAALLLGGRTLHSWAGIGRAGMKAEALVQHVLKDAPACDRWQSATLLVIDEVSMVSAWLLDVLDAIGRFARRCPSRPFGGLQVLLCGDFHQLPPPAREAEGWAFEAKCWGEAVEVAVELTDILRLDPKEVAFAEVLRQVRRGRLDETAWRELVRLSERPRDAARQPTEVVPTNSQADEINEAALRELGCSPEGQEDLTYASLQACDTASTPCRPASAPARGGSGSSAPARLRLRAGAVLVLTKTVRTGAEGERRLPNGLRCRVLGFVRLPESLYNPRCPGFDGSHFGLSERQFLLQHGGLLPRLAPLEAAGEDDEPFTLYPASFFEAGRSTVQLPARLGWAVTAHRAQGLSLDAAVVHLRGLFSTGQAYVALSRCRRAADLWIAGGLPARRADGSVPVFAPDPKVAAFHSSIGGE